MRISALELLMLGPVIDLAWALIPALVTVVLWDSASLLLKP